MEMLLDPSIKFENDYKAHDLIFAGHQRRNSKAGKI